MESESWQPSKQPFGQVLNSKLVTKENVPSIFAAEVLACIQSIQEGLELGLMDTEVEGAALFVIKKLLTERDDRSEI
ncbi:hypothetical protein Gogos_000830 [Gossypium gossypioides]|uniref:Uncharacterized protein n=1 Tax=Gossypium gossypioides TaxID=34282 RepID=A0A7J9CUF1_GOSGO|nr:hypothetical protein [Gossypium gossypioides]